MYEDYMNLVTTMDMGAPLMNMRVMMAAEIQPERATTSNIAPVPAEPCCVEGAESDSININLAEFDNELDADDDSVKRTAYYIINEIKSFDTTNAEKYNLQFNQHRETEAGISIFTINPPTTEMIQRISISLYQ